jgi:hypothetical protein
MGIIKISDIYNETRTSKHGKKYTVRLVKGTKYGTDEAWEQPIFDNNKKLLAELDEFGKGDVANFVYKKNGNFYDVVSIEQPDPDMIAKIDSGEVEVPTKKSGGGYSGGTRGGGAKTSGGLTKEEWAEKDRLTNIRIAKAVALKAAVDVGKKTAKTITAFADELVPYLLDTGSDDTKDTGDDPLDPPVN